MDGGSDVGLPALPLPPPRTPPCPKTTRAVPSSETLSPATLTSAAQCIAIFFSSRKKGVLGSDPSNVPFQHPKGGERWEAGGQQAEEEGSFPV